MKDIENPEIKNKGAEWNLMVYDNIRANEGPMS